MLGLGESPDVNYTVYITRWRRASATPPQRKKTTGATRATASTPSANKDKPNPSANKEKRNYIIVIQIRHIETPRVNRMLCVPPSTTFYELHTAIQIAFGWAFSHTHNFQVENISAICIGDADPPRSSGPRILLTIGDPEFLGYVEPDMVANERTTKLSDVFEDERYSNKHIEYTYDFGDSWEHSILLFGRAEAFSESSSLP
jgi:Plasmid pRiA4b ORF-3-like protein